MELFKIDKQRYLSATLVVINNQQYKKYHAKISQFMTSAKEHKGYLGIESIQSNGATNYTVFWNDLADFNHWWNADYRSISDLVNSGYWYSFCRFRVAEVFLDY